MVYEIDNINKIYQDAYDKALVLAKQYKIDNAEQWAKDFAKIELNKQLQTGITSITTEPELDKKERIELGVSLSTGIEDKAFKITSGKGERADTVLYPADKDYSYSIDCYCHNKGGRCKGHSTNYRCETIAISYDDIKKMFGWRNIPFDSDGNPYLTEFYHAFNNGMVSQSYCVKCRRKKPKKVKKVKKITQGMRSQVKSTSINRTSRKNRLRVSQVTEKTKWACTNGYLTSQQFNCSKTATGIVDILNTFGIQGAKLVEPKNFWTTKNAWALKTYRPDINEDRFIQIRCKKCEEKRRKTQRSKTNKRSPKIPTTTTITRTRKGGLPNIVIKAGKNNNTPINVTMDRIKWYKTTAHPLICLCEIPHYTSGKPSANKFIYEVAGKGVSKGILPTLVWKDYYNKGRDYRVPNKHMKITSNGHVLICGDTKLCSQFNIGSGNHGKQKAHTNLHNKRDSKTGQFLKR